jgi:hypothetical protein
LQWLGNRTRQPKVDPEPRRVEPTCLKFIAAACRGVISSSTSNIICFASISPSVPPQFRDAANRYGLHVRRPLPRRHDCAKPLSPVSPKCPSYTRRLLMHPLPAADHAPYRATHSTRSLPGRPQVLWNCAQLLPKCLSLSGAMPRCRGEARRLDHVFPLCRR